MQFIIDNIFILLPLAILIGVRIIGARKKAEEKNSPNQQAQSEQKPGRLFDFLGDEEGFPGAEAVRRESLEPKPKPAKKPKRTPPKDTVIRPQLGEAIDVSFQEITQKAPLGANPVQSSPGKDLTERLNLLTPLQRAVAMAEVLGPPKGI